MPKRPSDAGMSSQRLSQPAPFKRSKKEPTPEQDDVMVIDDGLSSISDSSEAEEESAPPVHDPEFYYEDGSIIFRVGDVLFKVHASLLKIESGDFEKKFDVPPKLADATKSRGTCDENPIIIPDAKASQFRNLMEVIYRPHYLEISAFNANVWQQFVFYLNVSWLANRFAMNRVEDWSRPELADLVQASGKKVSRAAQAYEPKEVKEEEEDEGKTPIDDKDAEKGDGGVEKGEGAAGSQGSANGKPASAGGSGASTSSRSSPANPIGSNPKPSSNPNNTTNSSQSNKANDANKANQADNASKEDTADNGSESSRSSRSTRSPSAGDEDDSDSDDDKEDEDMADGDSKDEIDLPPEEEVHPAFQLLDALFYAESVSDSPLHYDVRNVLQHYLVHPDYLPILTLVDLFKVSDLQEKDPAMFGFLFIVLLDQGNQVWKQGIFTRMDRMAFFSAQSYLTPFPDSLKSFVAVPLFNKPISAKSFATIFLDNTTDKSCVEECYTKAFTHWQEQFDEDYYVDVGNKDTLAPIKALITLPRRRLDLAEKLSESKCKNECHLKLLSQVDRDIQGLYARLAEYYQGIE